MDVSVNGMDATYRWKWPNWDQWSEYYKHTTNIDSKIAYDFLWVRIPIFLLSMAWLPLLKSLSSGIRMGFCFIFCPSYIVISDHVYFSPLSVDCRSTVGRRQCHRFIPLIVGILSRFKQDIVLQCLPAVVDSWQNSNHFHRILVTLMFFSVTFEQVLTQMPWSLVFESAPPRKRGPVLFLRWYWRISGESPLADSQPTVDRLSADGRLTACRPTVGQQSADRSTDSQ